MIVSVTERPVYKRCRRQWLVNSRNRWGMTKIVAPTPLALGTLVHDTLGIWLDMHKQYQTTGDKDFLLPKGGLAQLFIQYADKTINEAKDVYRQQVGAPMDESELAPLMQSVTMGHAMMLNYQERWQQPVPQGFEIWATEMHCAVPIPGTEHTEEWLWEYAADPAESPDMQYVPGTGWIVHKQYDTPQLHFLQGRLDGILRETRTGRFFVLEHKTYGQRPREDVLFANDQFLAYHWMLLQIASDLGLDPAMVAGVAYDGLWKRAAPPKVVDGHPGTMQDLFCRRLVTRPVQELVEFENMLAMEVTEMASNPYIYHNRTGDGSCFWHCNDNQLCLAMSRGEDYQWLLRSQYKRKTDAEDDVLTRMIEAQW